jgi:pseudouridine-5'-phosphate glycosidase
MSGTSTTSMDQPHPLARVALETTLLLHGVPREAARGLAKRLSQAVMDQGAIPRLVGVVEGKPVVGMSDEQLERVLNESGVAKVNTANLGAALFRGKSAATTVSTTMELAARASVAVFATGGIGGVHRGKGEGKASHDVSADLFAFTRFPVAVVTSGVKSILDIAATREVLETLGVTVVGYQTDVFPAFYLREPDVEGVGKVDARFDDVKELGAFVRFEMARTNRGIVVCNPIPREFELRVEDWRKWLSEAETRVARENAGGRDATPALLGALHEISGGATLRANVELVVSNARVAGQIARAMVR